jgi:hypothetical protein
MIIIEDCTIDTSDDVYGLDFPISGCTIVHNGSRTTINVPSDNGRTRLDVLVDSPEPQQRDGATIFTGRSQFLSEDVHVDPDDLTVTFKATDGWKPTG